VLLVLEVRTNTDVSRIAAYQAVTRDFDDFRSMILNDPELLEIFAQLIVSGQYPDPSGDPVTRARLFLLVDNQFSGNERAYIAYRGGIIGDQEWPRISRALCAEFADLPQDMRDRTLFRLTDDFGDYLQTECEL
jgi:hypothetical protein